MKWLLAALVIWAAWRLLRPAPPRRAVPADLSRRDAARLLGIDPDADEQVIRDAHRRRIAAVHPDRGGSGEATRDLNAARDRLLRG